MKKPSNCRQKSVAAYRETAGGDTPRRRYPISPTVAEDDRRQSATLATLPAQPVLDPDVDYVIGIHADCRLLDCRLLDCRLLDCAHRLLDCVAPTARTDRRTPSQGMGGPYHDFLTIGDNGAACSPSFSIQKL